MAFVSTPVGHIYIRVTQPLYSLLGLYINNCIMRTKQYNSIELSRKYKQEVFDKQINNHLKYSIQAIFKKKNIS